MLLFVACSHLPPSACGCLPLVPIAILFVPARQKVVALGAKHQTLLERLGQVEADITAAVSLHESREAVSAEEAQKVGYMFVCISLPHTPTEVYVYTRPRPRDPGSTRQERRE